MAGLQEEGAFLQSLSKVAASGSAAEDGSVTPSLALALAAVSSHQLTPRSLVESRQVMLPAGICEAWGGLFPPPAHPPFCQTQQEQLSALCSSSPSLHLFLLRSRPVGDIFV